MFPFGRTCVEVFISSGSELLFGVVVLFSFSFVRLFGKILIVIGSTHACYVCRKCLELFNVLNKRGVVYSRRVFCCVFCRKKTIVRSRFAVCRKCSDLFN